MPGATFKSTVQVADELKVKYHAIYNLLRYRIIESPVKGPSGDLVWTPRDVAAARQALAKKTAAKKNAG